MNCMRCGREIAANQVFCPDCLAEMEKCPVNPSTVVRLPRRPDPTLKKLQRRKGPSEEEQIRTLKKRVKLLSWLLAIAVALLIAMTIPAVRHMVDQSISFLPGQNYSSASGTSSAD